MCVHGAVAYAGVVDEEFLFDGEPEHQPGAHFGAHHDLNILIA